MAPYKVLLYDFNNKTPNWYDIMPYLFNTYNECKKKKNWWMLDDNKKEPQTFKEYHTFVLNASRYQFWSRCEYEFIMCQWPYDEKNPLNDSHKIDAYAQIEANSEVITNVFIKNINKK